jgi:hypothetical protein
MCVALKLHCEISSLIQNLTLQRKMKHRPARFGNIFKYELIAANSGLNIDLYKEQETLQRMKSSNSAKYNLYLDTFLSMPTLMDDDVSRPFRRGLRQHPFFGVRHCFGMEPCHGNVFDIRDRTSYPCNLNNNHVRSGVRYRLNTWDALVKS